MRIIYRTRPERIRDLEAIIASLGWSKLEQNRRRKLQNQLHRLKDREADRIASIRRRFRK